MSDFPTWRETKDKVEKEMELSMIKTETPYQVGDRIIVNEESKVVRRVTADHVGDTVLVSGTASDNAIKGHVADFSNGFFQFNTENGIVWLRSSAYELITVFV